MSASRSATTSAAPDALTSAGAHERPPHAEAGLSLPADVTSTGTAHEAQGQREAVHFRALAEQSLDIISVLDAVGTIRFESPSVERWTGWKPEELVGRSAFELIHPADYAKVLARFSKGILLPGSIEIVQYRFRHKDGSWRVLESWGRNLLTDKSVRGVIVNSRDVTERLEHEQRYRTLVDRLPVAVVIHQEGRIVFTNPAAVRLLGAADAESLIDLPVLAIAAPETQDIVRERIEQAQRGEPPAWLEQRALRRDGTLADVEAISLGTTHNGKPAVQTILHEITDRKKADRQREVQYAATRVLSQTSQPDTLQQFLRIVCEGLQWTVGEVWLLDSIGGGLRVVAAHYPPEPKYTAFVEAAGRNRCPVNQGLPGRVWAERQALWIRDVVGEPVFLRREVAMAAGLHGAVAFPVQAGETFSGVIQVFSPDISEPDPQMLELLKILGTQLGQFLERRQIQEQLMQAQKMEAVGQLAGGVAHDFNNLLTIMTGHTSLALAVPGLAAEARTELRQVSAAVDCAANLTRQLLTFSRKQVMQKRSIKLDKVINDLAKMLGRIIGEHVALSLRHAPNLPCIDADVGMVEQIVMNLAVNARDAMPDGGSLIISAQPAAIDCTHARRVPQARAGSFVRLEVRDNGCGIAPEILPRIFEPFFTTKPLGRGTGLGLATVYGIVKQHDGWIEVDSEMHVGTAFRIFFPASPAATPCASAPDTAAPVRGQNQTILLVEDESSVRVLARRLLERAGYRIVEAATGCDALRLWEQQREKIDLVLTDMVMPGGMSGLQLADRLRTLSAALPIVFTSGYSSELASTRGHEEFPFLPKPYTAQDLLNIIARTLGS